MNPTPPPSSPEKIRFAIIGCGHIGLRHIEFIRANPECELVAVCDPLPEAHASFLGSGQDTGAVPFFTNEDQLLEQDFDVLCVATPNGLHERHALKALQHDRHVLIEKPMALTSAACANIIREARNRNRQLFCVMQNRYSPPSVWLKYLLERQALGRIFLVSVNCLWNRDDRYYRKGNWKGTAAMDGGVLFTQFSHFIDSLLWLFGDITGIDARLANFSHGDNSIDFEDTGVVNFNFVRGGMGSFNFTTSVHRQNLESSMTIIAEKGSVRIGGQYMEKVESCTLENYPAVPVPGPTANHGHIYDNIVSVLKRGGHPDIDPQEASNVVETIEKIYSRKTAILKRIYFTVTNDLVYDQRMIRICRSLAADGYSVVLVGRRSGDSPPLKKEPFEQKRLRCLFRRGKGFYLGYNLRLLLFLWFRKMDAICAIDLDTILPSLWVSRRKRIPRIYDAHELFSEMKEVIGRPRIKVIWDRVERYAVPQFALGYTVSRSIVEEFRRRYGVDYALIRNLPVLETGSPAPATTDSSVEATTNDASPIKETQPDRFIIYQGAVNEARGLESLIPAMRHVDSRLLIYGTGNLMDHCLRLTNQLGLAGKVIFRGMVGPAELREISKKAYIGINLVEPLGLNQYYSLANKFFDYIHAGIPQVTMDFPEYRLVNDRYPIGLLIPTIDEKKIADALNNLLGNDVLYGMFKENCQRARRVYNWQEEEKNLLRFYKKIFV